MNTNEINEKIDNLKKHPRKDSVAKGESIKYPIKGFDPMQLIVQLHQNAKARAKAVLKKELQKQKDLGEDAVIKFSNSCIKNKGRDFVEPEDGNVTIGIYITNARQKGFFSRLFSGSMANWFKSVGMIAMKAYVEAFAGAEFAKQVTDDTVFNGIGDENHEGRTGYFCTLKMPKKK